MEFDPPIKSRNTDELIKITNYPEKWNETAVEQAQQELNARGITTEEQAKQVLKWEKQTELELSKELEARAIESFGLFDLFWMAIKWPYTILFDWSLKKDGYLRMYKERLYSIGAGMVIWIVMLFYVDYEYDRSQRAWQNEVNSTDIYEWELENYTKEEIVEFRKESIEQVISLVQENELKSIPTYVILESDTIDNFNVKELRKIDPLTIRDIVFQGDFEPEPFDWVEIMLLKPADNSR